MGSFEKDLMTGERIVQRAFVSRVIYLPAILVAALAILATGFLRQQDNPDLRDSSKIIGPLIGAWALYLALAAWARRGSARFAVSNKRVFIRHGIIRRHSTEILLSQVEGISVTQGFWSRLFNFGTVTIEGTGGDAEPYRKIANPLTFRRAVQEQIESYTRNAAAPAPSAPAPSPPGPEDRYARLLKLDELKQKGILTEDEFQREKRRLLEG
jgi:membrane protein YdbS with pleckstrin-like domain